MATPNNNVVVFLTQNQKLMTNLQTALPGMVVIKAENIEAVNKSIKHNAVGAVVLHVTNYAGWIIFEFLKTGYPDIPRFALLAPSLSGKDYDHESLAAKYGAAAILDEKGIKQMATLIELEIKKENTHDPTSKEKFIQTFGEVNREIQRISQEFIITGMRTLPQPEIGEDTQEKLLTALKELQKIKITP